MENEKPGFYVWFKTVEAMAELTFEEKGMMYAAAEEYARNGVLPVFDDRLLRSIWARVKADLDSDDTRYKKAQSDNQIKGWKSYFKRIYAPANGIDPNDEVALEEYIQQRLTAVDNGGQQATNTNINTSFNSISNNSVKSNNKAVQPPRRYGEYSNVLLSAEELKKLQTEFPGDWEARIEELSEYIASSGKNYKNHLATLRRWAKDEKSKQNKRFSSASGDWCEGITPDDHANDIEFPY